MSLFVEMVGLQRPQGEPGLKPEDLEDWTKWSFSLIMSLSVGMVGLQRPQGEPGLKPEDLEEDNKMICLANSDEFVLKQGGWSENCFFSSLKRKSFLFLLIKANSWCEISIFFGGKLWENLDVRFKYYQDICVMCGSLGNDLEGRLICCAQCGQCYHPQCVNVKAGGGVLSIVLELVVSLDYLGFFVHPV
jgi:hypothetical protein